MRDMIAIIICKFARFIINILGKNGGSKPGDLALKISPNILSRLSYPKIFIMVTGTNGKTSTTNMISRILSASGKKVVTNSMGDNLLIGAATSILLSSNLRGKLNADAIVLEMDEMVLAKHLNDFPVTDLLITNFFRDQLDRAGEMATVITKIGDAISLYDGRLFVCADDPNSYNIDHSNRLTFGLGCGRFSVAPEGYKEVSEGKFCPKCHERLIYEYYQYSHLGGFKCECGYKRIDPDLEAIVDSSDEFLITKAFYGIEEGYKFKTRSMGLYHVYNEISAIAVTAFHGVNPCVMEEVLSNFELGIGRMETIKMSNGRTALLNLVKNPTGVNEVIKYIVNLPKNDNKNHLNQTVLLVLGDAVVDGTDVSWIWDADFEALKALDLTRFICTGKRGYDMALRLKYGQIGEAIVLEDLGAAVREFATTGGFVLSTYSNLFDVRDELGGVN